MPWCPIQPLFRAHRVELRLVLARPRPCRTSRARTRREPHRSGARQSDVEYRVSASCSGESSMTTRCPMPAAVVPNAAPPASTTRTRSPSRASATAHAAPTMPAPTMIASARRCAHAVPRPPRKGSRGSKRSVASPVTNAVPRTCGIERAVRAGGEPAREQAPGDALLAPRLA